MVAYIMGVGIYGPFSPVWEIGHRFPVTAPKGNGIRHAKTQFFAYNLGGFKKDALEHCCATDCLVLPVFPLEIERALRVFRLIPISHAWVLRFSLATNLLPLNPRG